MSSTLCLRICYISRSTEPDWKVGHDLIDKLVKNWEKNGLPDDIAWMNDPENAKEILHENLNTLEEAVLGQRNDVSSLEFFGHDIYITGGMTWGDDPTDCYTAIETLSNLKIMEACGFNPELPDYEGILKEILEKKELIPLLMDINQELNKLIKESSNERQE
jgi:hypothetical protein